MENVVYTIRICPYCARAKNLLNGLGIPFREVLVETREETMRLKEKYNWRTFPMVILNGRFIGGYDDTQALVDSGEMGKILELEDTKAQSHKE